MKKSRLLIALLASAFCLTGTVGCSRSGGDKPGPVETTVTLDKNTLSLEVGQTATLKATASILDATISWKSSDNEVATVNEGVVSALAVGKATITASVSGTTAKATCELTVTKGGAGGDHIIEKPTTILIETTFNDDYGDIFKAAADALTAKEPNITVEYVKYSGSYSDLKDEVVKGVPTDNYPDIAAAYPDSVADFITANVALNMEPYMYNEDYGWTEEEANDFYSAYLEEGRNYSVKGTLSLPIAKSTEAMYYDYDKIIGLNLAAIDPTINGGNALDLNYINNLTWEELFGKLCPALLAYRETLGSEELKKAFLDQTTYSDWAIVGYDSDDNLFITLAEQYGYGYTSINSATGKGNIDFNNDGMKNLMKTFNSAFNNHYFATKGTLGTNANYRSNEDAMLFCIGSTGGVKYQYSANNPKNVRVAPIPHAAGGNNHIIQQGPSLAFLSHKVEGKLDENRAIASWLFYKELTTVSRITKWSTVTGYAPIRASVAESDEYLDYQDDTAQDPKTLEKLKAFNAQYVVSVSDRLFSSPVFKGSSEARTQVGGLLTKCVAEASLTDEKLNEYFQEAYNNAVLKL